VFSVGSIRAAAGAQRSDASAFAAIFFLFVAANCHVRWDAVAALAADVAAALRLNAKCRPIASPCLVLNQRSVVSRDRFLQMHRIVS
jgi:hypothetical protein